MKVDDRALEVTEGEVLVRSALHGPLDALCERAVFRSTCLGHELRVSLRRLRSSRVSAGMRQGIGDIPSSAGGNGLEHDQDRVMRQDRDQRIRKQVVDVGDAAFDAAKSGDLARVGQAAT